MTNPTDPLFARLGALPGRDIDELRRERIRARCHAELARVDHRRDRRRRVRRASIELGLASTAAGLMVIWAVLTALS
jgi:hypothetical protein